MAAEPKPSRWALWLPLVFFAAFAALVLFAMLRPVDRAVKSAMIGKPLPQFSLAAATPAQPGLARADLSDGKPHLLNIFASWCVPCAAEAPQLQALKTRGIDVVGVAIRDKPEDLARFFAQYGNPFSRVGRDDISAIQFALGSSGVPETFVIDGKGVIRYQHIGDIRDDQVDMIAEKMAEVAQ